MSDDLISRQAAIDIVVFECGKWIGLAKEISKQLKQLPSAGQYTDDEIQRMQDIEQAQIEKAYDIGYAEGKADAVPVVRCKECKWSDEEGRCEVHETLSGNDFCSKGERREE